MRNLKRNQRPFVALNYKGVEDVRDANNNLTGEKEITYYPAQVLMAHISGAKGSSYVEIFGTDISYDKVIVMSRAMFEKSKLNENSVFCIDTRLTYMGRTPIYDYHVKRIADDLNEVLIAVEKVRDK